MKVWIVGGRAREEFFKPTAGTEIWGLNSIRPKFVPKWHRMFNLHMFEHLERDWLTGLVKERDWANEHPDVPFYILDEWPREILPNQVIFPRADIEAFPYVNPSRKSYHSSSFDWMVAFALVNGLIGGEELTQLTIQGVSLNMESGEPISSRACLEYWCGIAEGLGVTVDITPECGLFAQYHLVKSRSVYGYDDIQLIEDRTGAGLRPTCDEDR